MSKEDKYSDLKKELFKEKIFNFKKHFFGNFTFFKNYSNKKLQKKILKHNLAPDVSTVTENIALVLDEEIIEIIRCQPKMAALLLSNPIIVEIPKDIFPKPGWKYINNTFKEK
jgi:hypothetical protein